MALVQKAWFQIYLNNMVVVLVVVLFNSNIVNPFLTRECAHAHERVIAIVDFSLGRSLGWSVGWLVGWLVRLLTFGHAQ